MTVYIIIEYAEPQGDTLSAITNLPMYFEDFNEDFGTDYSTMEEFNEDQIDRTMYAIIIPKTQ
jgi:hypothetical protein